MKSGSTKWTKSAGGIVVNPKGQILVVSQHGTTWSFPKGHIEEDEDEITAAKREIYEESGISDLEYVKPLSTYQRYKMRRDRTIDRTELKTIAMFLFRTKSTALEPVDPRNPEARWADKDDVANLLTHKKDRQFFHSIMREF